MSNKYALIIGNTEYTDPRLSQLTAPGRDAEDFARVLKDQEISAFDDVNILMNQPEFIIREAIDDFFNQKKPGDLLVLYFSGHGVRDDLGALYLAVKNTNLSKLRSTAIKSDFIRDAMDQSRSKRQVLILDCCNSGAFAQGTKGATNENVGTFSAFKGGYGRIILTASDATQFAWEGDKVIGNTDNSLFTHFLVEGLKGEADLDGDGRITVDELYDYAFEKVRLATPKQTPSKFSSKQQGEIVLRHGIRVENIKPVPLPGELMGEIEDTRPYVREAAVQQLEKILKGRNLGLIRSAKEALEKIADDDHTTRHVARMAIEALESHRQMEQKVEDEQKVRETLAALKAEKERAAQENVNAERVAAQKVGEERKTKAEVARPVGAPTSVKEPSKGISRKLVIGIAVAIITILTISLCFWAGSAIIDKWTAPTQTPTFTVALTPGETGAPAASDGTSAPTATITVSPSPTQTPTATHTPTKTPKPAPTPTKKKNSGGGGGGGGGGVCLSIHTQIDTPRGPVAVEDLRVGDLVWTVDASGARVSAVILRTAKTSVPASHQMAHVILSDGRELWASPGHPTADGRTLDMLGQGDLLDGARVIQAERVIYGQPATYDILPAGATGFYWADGILIGSTLTNK